MKLRILTDIIILIAVIQGWWLLALLIAAISCWYFPSFLEIVVAGFVFDALFGMSDGSGIFGFLASFTSIIIYLFMYIVRKSVR